MSRFERLQCHHLATAYNLRSHSLGSGKRRYTVLTKTVHTSLISLSESMDTIHDLLSIEPFEAPPNQIQSGKKVGEDAIPIGANNIGNKLLRSMGWTGGGLGSQEQGIKNPIEAIMKNNKHGLGFGHLDEELPRVNKKKKKSNPTLNTPPKQNSKKKFKSREKKE